MRHDNTCTRGLDLSGGSTGAGGIGGLLARSAGYSGGAGTWNSHNYYHADGNGNITMHVDANQAAVATYRYDPFGNTTYTSGLLASANTMRFSSKPRHPNSGLYNYGYRWYSPNLQRWISRDPLEEAGGLNLYRFVYNSPAKWIDAVGLQSLIIEIPPILLEPPPLAPPGEIAPPAEMVGPRPVGVPLPRIPGVSYPEGGPFQPEGTVENPFRPGSFGRLRPKTGKFEECWRFDKGNPNKPGWRGIDHFHYWNSNEHMPPPLPTFRWFSVPATTMPVTHLPASVPVPPGVTVLLGLIPPPPDDRNFV